MNSAEWPVDGNCRSNETLKFGFIRSLSTKASLINVLITCETWLKPYPILPLNEASPPDYNYAHVPHATKLGTVLL